MPVPTPGRESAYDVAMRWAVAAMILGGLACAVLLFGGNPPDPGPEIAPSTAAAPIGQGDLQGRGAETLPSPAAPPPPTVELYDPLEDRRAALTNERTRRTGVRGLFDRDVRDPRLVSTLEQVIAESPDGYTITKAQAMVVIMRTAGTRALLSQLARETAAKYGEKQGFSRYTKLVAPATGEALFRLHAMSLRPGTPPDRARRLRELADLLAGDVDKGLAAIDGILRRSQGAEAFAWLDVARFLRPVPASFAHAWSSNWTALRPEQRTPWLGLLDQPGLDWHPQGVGDALADRIVTSWSDLLTSDRPVAMRALGRLGSGSKHVLDFLIGQARGASAREALVALQQTGTRATAVVPDLIRLGTVERPEWVAEVTLAVLYTRSRRGVAFLGERLRVGSRGERQNIARSIAEVEGAGTLRPLLLAEVQRDNQYAILALARLDPNVEHPETLAGFGHALHTAAPAHVARKAFEATQELTSVPDALLEHMIAGLMHPDVPVQSLGSNALADLGRLGARARAWIPRLLTLSREAEIKGPAASAWGALSILGEVAGDDRHVRNRLFEILGAYAPRARAGKPSAERVPLLRAALRGLGGVNEATRASYELVAGLRGAIVDRRRPFTSLARRVLENPEWHRIYLAYKIKLTFRPQARPVVWR